MRKKVFRNVFDFIKKYYGRWEMGNDGLGDMKET